MPSPTEEETSLRQNSDTNTIKTDKSRASSRRRTLKVCGYGFQVLSIAVVVIGISSQFLRVPDFYGLFLRYALDMSEGAPFYESWAKADHSTMVNLYLWNLTNYESFKLGLKPVYQEVGPIQIITKINRVNVQFKDNGATLSYSNQIILNPAPGQEALLSSQVIHPNIPLMSYLHLISQAGWAKRWVMRQMLNAPGHPDTAELFLTHTVRDILFGMKHELTSLQGFFGGSPTWAVFTGSKANNSIQPQTQIHTANPNKFRWKKYKGSDCRDDPMHGLNYLMNDIPTFDGFLVDPLYLRQHDKIQIYREDLKDSGLAVADKNSVKHIHSDAELKRYYFTGGDLQKGQQSAERYPVSALDIRRCNTPHAPQPVLATAPYFLGLVPKPGVTYPDFSLFNETDLLRERYGSHYDYLAELGVAAAANLRMQANFEMELPGTRLNSLRNVAKGKYMIPFLWSETVFDLKDFDGYSVNLVQISMRTLENLGWILLCMGLCSFVGILVCQNWSEKSRLGF